MSSEQLSQPTESESLHPWPRLITPARAGERLIISLELALSTNQALSI